MKYLIVLALIGPHFASAEQVLECPKSLEVKSTAKSPPGWQVVDLPEPNTLERIGFFSGDPQERASLAPDSSRTSKGESRDVWKLSSNAPEKTWVACFYAGTALLLAKPLGTGITHCEVRYRTTRSGSRLSVSTARCD